MRNWESIRAKWVNGEQKEAISDLINFTKLGALEIVLEALVSDHKLRGSGGTRSGDLTDLREILTSIKNGVSES